MKILRSHLARRWYWFLPLRLADRIRTPMPKGNPIPTRKTVRLTIVVTGGEDKKPVDSASVYVKYVEERKLAQGQEDRDESEDQLVRSVPRS